MDFNQTQAIYLQIAEYVCDKVQSGAWLQDEKIPSVRELAVQLAVNPNTIMRSYEYLQQQGIIYTKRGLGYFIDPGAKNIIVKTRKEHFIKEELPAFFHKVFLLDIDWKDLHQQYQTYLQSQNN